MNIKNKIIITMLTCMIIFTVQANTYMEVKNEILLRDLTSQTSTTHYRLGYKFDNNMYVEVGPMTDEKSFELGYNFKKGNWTFKGKLEDKNVIHKDYLGRKIETEIRYTFGD